MAKEANLEFSIDQSHIPTKMEISIGNGNLKPRFFSNGSISPKSLSIAQKNPFSGFEGENPYNHLRSFEQLCSTRSCSDLSPDKFRVRLFTFSLARKAKAWYFQQEKEVTMDWRLLRDKFCAKYFPLSRLMHLRNHIINFRQTKTESLSQAWTRFHDLIHTCPNHGLPDIVLIHHFQHGLSRDNVFRLLALTKRSLFHENPTEGLEILERILAMPVRGESQSEEIKDHSRSWIYRIITYLSFFFQTLMNYFSNQESHSKKK
jgi:hypothetical protein